MHDVKDDNLSTYKIFIMMKFINYLTRMLHQKRKMCTLLRTQMIRISLFKYMSLKGMHMRREPPCAVKVTLRRLIITQYLTRMFTRWSLAMDTWLDSPQISASVVWRSLYLANSLYSVGYRSCLEDPDIRIQEGIKYDNALSYEYLAIYMADTLCISNKPNDTMKAIVALYHLKDNSLEIPRTYLGAQVVQYKLPHDASKICWGLSSAHYIASTIKRC
jgi:hypothetical protein